MFLFHKLKIMTTEELATRLVDYCRKGEFEKAQKELFADNAVSNEPFATPAFEKVTKGLPAIIEKGHKFQQMVSKMHGLTVSEPLVTKGSLAFTLLMDVTMKEQGREQMKELCVYEVKDGKVVAEHFFM